MKVDPVLQNLLKELKAGRFRPRAIRRFVTQGIGHAIDLAWSLKNLRRSFYYASGIMLGVLAAIGFLLDVSLQDGIRFSTLCAEVVLFIVVFGLTLVQLGLVRSESSGECYERFTFPNVLTLLRLLVVPYLTEVLASAIVDPQGYAKALVALMIFAVLTDALDGMFARLLRQTSEFGRIYDPVVDIVFHVSLTITLYNGRLVSVKYILMVLLRYLLPPVAGFFLYLFKEPFQVKSTWMGKVSSLLLSIFETMIAVTLAVNPYYLLDVIVWMEPLCILACGAAVLYFVVYGLRIMRGQTKRQYNMKQR